jgi:hypothetical protein
MHKGRKFFFLALICLVITGCGDGPSSENASIEAVTIRDNTIEPGAQTEVRVRFSAPTIFSGITDGEPDYVSDAFELTVYFPSTTEYIADSTRVTDSLFGDVLFGNPDKKSPSQFGECRDGRRFVRYRFDRQELQDVDADSLVSLRLMFDIKVPQIADGERVGAAITGGGDACGYDMDESVVLTVRSE